METNSLASDIATHDPHGLQTRRPNRLIHQKSPYLLQHAYNPVDWFPWGEEAFNKALQEDKPVLLSIGYSTCHWCHVMERESFEDDYTAALINEVFVSIKVDREERPDLDHIYMTVCQMMTGRGGWPLNVIMTPDKKPFFAGTYFPLESRHGRIGMIELSQRVREMWKTQREEVLHSAASLMGALKAMSDDSPGDELGADVLETAYRQLAERYDERYGGFSRAPKFPTPHILFFLLRYWKRTRDAKALEMVENTLHAMRNGGIYDHVGFGFHRYSTDDHWFVPHFEKMLYDQALIVMAYIEAYQATGNDRFAITVREVLEYVLRDMVSPEGGFYSAEDADSEGVEGKFYIWRLEEIRETLDSQEASLVERVFNAHSTGNFHEEATGRITGRNILFMAKPVSGNARELAPRVPDSPRLLESARSKLFQAREKRVHPGKDDKILTDWNGLMIAALSKAAQALGRAEYADAARKAADFILETMVADGRLLHRYRGNEAGLPAHADDYAFLIWGLIELYEATFDVRYLKSALSLNGQFLDRFWDSAAGGFFFTARDGEDLLLRKKEIYDGATPSANSVAALNLIRLSRITGDPALEILSRAIGKAFSGNIRQFPSAYTQLLLAVDFTAGQSSEVVIAGVPHTEETLTMLQRLRERFLPNKVVLFRPTDEDSPEIALIAPYAASHTSLDGKPTAYVCRDFNCELPTTDPDAMLRALGEGPGRGPFPGSPGQL